MKARVVKKKSFLKFDEITEEGRYYAHSWSLLFLKDSLGNLDVSIAVHEDDGRVHRVSSNHAWRESERFVKNEGFCVEI